MKFSKSSCVFCVIKGRMKDGTTVARVLQARSGSGGKHQKEQNCHFFFGRSLHFSRISSKIGRFFAPRLNNITKATASSRAKTRQMTTDIEGGKRVERSAEMPADRQAAGRLVFPLALACSKYSSYWTMPTRRVRFASSDGLSNV